MAVKFTKVQRPTRVPTVEDAQRSWQQTKELQDHVVGRDAKVYEYVSHPGQWNIDQRYDFINIGGGFRLDLANSGGFAGAPVPLPAGAVLRRIKVPGENPSSNVRSVTVELRSSADFRTANSGGFLHGTLPSVPTTTSLEWDLDVDSGTVDYLPLTLEPSRLYWLRLQGGAGASLSVYVYPITFYYTFEY